MSLVRDNLLILPIILPLFAVASLLLLDTRSWRLKSVINLGTSAANLLVTVTLLGQVEEAGVGAIRVYLASNWQAPFGIVLVADRLSVLMLTLTGAVSVCAATYAIAGWSRSGVYFHALFQILLMGLNGAFLTGDLFNLFVFFEVMLAASYGLQLHGSGRERVSAGLHYIAVNLLASSLFLIGLALIYGIVGTLSMADVAAKLPLVPASDRGLLHAAFAVLSVAFLTKAAAWPLNFWLVPAYTSASAPVAAFFALMTKVGVYALLRLWTLFFASSEGPSALFGAEALLLGGLATGACGVLGLLGSRRIGRIAGFSILVSSGTLLAALGTGSADVIASALFYLVTATLSASALFLLVEVLERPGLVRERPPLSNAELAADDDTNLDDDETALVGQIMPVPLALVGLAFIVCALLIAGLPPLSGFLAKVALAASLLRALGGVASWAPPALLWCLFALLLGSGLVALISMARAGIHHFFTRSTPPRLTAAEGLPLLALLVLCGVISARAERVLQYTAATAGALQTPRAYIEAVLSAPAVPNPSGPEARQEQTP
ncbi:MAG TPA: monovalent cation/H+ antiporter subunit D [Polyangiales bacterium]